ncbi:MAG TPA: hypothetical protein VLF89_03845 [Candidatus Saccharimonadales bacterium]|nr:hypothetical protein [Candidatus Saccharimonadales bacterium]
MTNEEVPLPSPGETSAQTSPFSQDTTPPLHEQTTFERVAQSKVNQDKDKKKFEALREQIKGTVEIVSDVPVFSLEEDISHDLQQITQFYGEETVYRIINADFIPDAIEYGTDKASVDEHDFRHVTNDTGLDIWSVEEKAVAMGLRKSDAFCGTPYRRLIEDIDAFDPSGLGIPKDRTGLLVFDATKLQHIEGTDGYAFTNPNSRKEALLAVIRFKEHLVDFEERLATLTSVDEKVQLLEDEVFKNLNTTDDLQTSPYIALKIISLMKSESLSNAQNPSPISAERIKRLGIIAERLDYETKMIRQAKILSIHITLTRNAFAEGDKNKMELTSPYPDFVIRQASEFLQEEDIDDKYKQRFMQVIETAQKCKDEFGLK